MKENDLMKKVTNIIRFFTMFVFLILIISGCQSEPDVLSESEVEVFSTEFFNGGTDNMNNMLLSSEYSRPEEINLFELFYNGMKGAYAQISEAELAALTELCMDAPYLDIMKVTTEEMDTFLQKNMGIGLEQTQKKGLDSFYYLEEYDSYYLVHGDTNFAWCTVVSGTWIDDNMLEMEYEKEYEEGRWIVTLQKTETGYLFVSNVHSADGDK